MRSSKSHQGESRPTQNQLPGAHEGSSGSLGYTGSFYFPLSVGFQPHFHTGLFVHIEIGSFPLEPTEGSTWMQESIRKHPGFQVLAPPGRAFSVHPIPCYRVILSFTQRGTSPFLGSSSLPHPLPGSWSRTSPSLKLRCLQGDRGIIQPFSKAALVPGSAIPGELVPSLCRRGRTLGISHCPTSRPEPLLLLLSPQFFTARPSMARQQAFSQGHSAFPSPQIQRNPKRMYLKLFLKASRESEPSFNRSK